MLLSSHSAFLPFNSTHYTPASWGQFEQSLSFSNSGLGTRAFNFSKD
jgi:hypothetical protein